MNLNSKIELEQYFANHFDTVLFPVLADLYLKDEDTERARKVCEIGLENHPGQPDGLFVLANIALTEGNLQEAEKHLKQIIAEKRVHLQGAILLARIQETLHRSENTIRKVWEHVLDICPNNKLGLDYLKQLPKAKVEKKQIPPEESKSDQHPAGNELEALSVSPRLATFTLVSVLKNQGLYYQALEVLDVLEKKGLDKKRLEEERNSINELIHTNEI